MNRCHHRVCASAGWAKTVRSELLPWALDGLDLGPDVLEIGPGFGPTTLALARTISSPVAVELDAGLATRLHRLVGGTARVVRGDGSRLPFADGSFSAVVCFTMLHHVPSPALQDRLFAEACRVLRPGGLFAGSDSLPSLRFRLLHLFDTMVPVDPSALQDRLAAAGLSTIRINTRARRLRFAAARPLPSGS